MLRLQTFHARLSPAFAERERNPRPAHGERPQFASVSESDDRSARGDCGGDVRGLLPQLHRQLHAVAKDSRPAQAGNGALKNILQVPEVVALYCHRKDNFCKPMEKPKIIAYLKPTCGWSQGVRAVLRKYDLSFEDRDIINDPLQRQEMIEKSGQMLSPCVEINGHMLPDISGEEVEGWMLANKICRPNDRTADAPRSEERV